MWRYGKSLWQLGQITTSYGFKQTEVRHFPYRLWIEPTNRCNLACVMCPNQEFSKDELGFMEWPLFTSIIDQAKGRVHDVNLHHRGEPTLHPKLPDMIRYAHENRVRTKLHTNGTTLTKDLSEALLDSGLELISFSFDGYTAEPYEKTRVRASFDRTLENIERFLDLRRTRTQSKPKAVMEVMEFETFDPADKARFIARLKKKGMDRIIVKQPHNWAGNVELDTFESETFSACTFPWHAMVILWNGIVGSCPHDFFAKIQYGDANKQSLEEIFNSPAIQTLRSDMLTGKLSSLKAPCSTCDSVRRKRVAGIPLASLKYIRE